MQNFIDPLRKTGRTKRMVEEAVRLQSLGERVCIVAKDVFEWEIQKVWISEDEKKRLKESGLHKIAVIQSNYECWSWLRWSASGFHPKTIYLIDHRAIESSEACQRVLREFHRFDINQTPGGHLFVEGVCRQCGHRTTDDPESCDSVQSKKGLYI